MTDIDLTPMNEAAARALFAEEQVSRAEIAAGNLGLTAEETAEFLVSTRDEAKAYWDAGELDGSSVITYREQALAVTLASWKDVARQAWIAGALWAMDDDRYAPTEEEARLANPYEEVWP